MTKWYGNLTNRLMEGGEVKPPEVGMGVTEYCYSDRHAYTIVEVAPNGKRFWMTHDDYTFKDGYGENYKSDTSNPRIEVRKFPKGWKIVKGNHVAVGIRDAYYDPHF